MVFIVVIVIVFIFLIVVFIIVPSAKLALQDLVIISVLLVLLPRFALSDDSHGPHAVGLNYGRLFEYARRVGITELYVLEESGVPNSAGRHVGARAVSGSWWEHPFWTQRASQA